MVVNLHTMTENHILILLLMQIVSQSQTLFSCGSRASEEQVADGNTVSVLMQILTGLDWDQSSTRKRVYLQ